MFTGLFYKKVGLEFARAFIATFALGLAIPTDLSSGKTAIVALAAAAAAAGLRAAQAAFTQLETPPDLREFKEQ